MREIGNLESKMYSVLNKGIPQYNILPDYRIKLRLILAKLWNSDLEKGEMKTYIAYPKFNSLRVILEMQFQSF